MSLGFGMGTMFEFFQSEGNDPVLMDILQIFVSDGEICSAVSLNILAEIPSRPLALATSRVIKSSVTSDSVHRISSGQSSARG